MVRNQIEKQERNVSNMRESEIRIRQYKARLPRIRERVIAALMLFAFSIVMIKVCIERINEIKKGEEDDLSKY